MYKYAATPATVQAAAPLKLKKPNDSLASCRTARVSDLTYYNKTVKTHMPSAYL